MERARVILASLLVAVIVAGSAAVLATPSPVPYSVYNTGPRGYSRLVSLLGASVASSPEGVGEGFAVIAPVSRNLSSRDIEVLEGLLEKARVLVVLDENGYSNGFLEGYGVRVTGYRVYDSIYNWGSIERPVATARLGGEGYRLALYTSSYIETSGGGVVVVAETSSLSYIDLDGSGDFTFGDRIAPAPVVAVANTSRGLLVVVADPDLLSNTCLDAGYDNQAFLRRITGVGGVVIVTGFSERDPLDSLRDAYYSSLSLLGLRAEARTLAVYALLVIGVWVASSVERKD